MHNPPCLPNPKPSVGLVSTTILESPEFEPRLSDNVSSKESFMITIHGTRPSCLWMLANNRFNRKASRSLPATGITIAKSILTKAVLCKIFWKRNDLKVRSKLAILIWGPKSEPCCRARFVRGSLDHPGLHQTLRQKGMATIREKTGHLESSQRKDEKTVDMEFAAAQMATGNFPGSRRSSGAAGLRSGRPLPGGTASPLQGIRSAAPSHFVEAQTQLFTSSRGALLVLDS
jgi:hypothetical protein